MKKAKKTKKKSDVARVFVADDHPIIRQGMVLLISQDPGLMVCGQAEKPSEVLRTIPKAQPDIAILDLSFGEGIEGLQLVRQLRENYPKLFILVLSMHDESVFAERLLRAGANGYIMKQEAADKILTAVHQVLKGEGYMSDKMKEKLLRRVTGGKTYISGSPLDSLSNREIEVFGLIGQGFGTRKIAETLHLSIKTIETHREHIKEKLEIGNSSELVHQAVQWLQIQSENAKPLSP